MSVSKGPEISPVSILRLATEELVDAELWDAITDKNLADWEAEWRPEIDKLLKALNKQGIERQLWNYGDSLLNPYLAPRRTG